MEVMITSRESSCESTAHDEAHNRSKVEDISAPEKSLGALLASHMPWKPRKVPTLDSSRECLDKVQLSEE